MTAHSNRIPANSVSRRALAVFVVCWLNMAIAPCAMAFQVVEESAHHAPAAGHEMAHGSHHASDSDVADCCDALQADCCELGSANVGQRGDKPQSQDEVLAVADDLAWPSLHIVATPKPEFRPPDPALHFPPLHKLFCVYLD